MPRLPFLDALRGWAILLVIAVHASITFQPASEFLHRLAWHGRMGVVLFFVVSAVALMLSFRQHGQEPHPVSSFFIRRFFRIAPMFYLGIVLSLLLDGLSPRADAPQGIDVHHVVLTALFLHGWWPDTINTVVFGGWSIAVETTFYLCFPLAVRFLRSRASLLLALAGSLLLAVVLRKLTNDFFFEQFAPSLAPTVRAFFYQWFPNQLPSFLIGMILALALDKLPPQTRKSDAIALCVLAFAALYSCLYVQPIQGLFGSNHLFAAAFALLAYALANWEIPLLVNRLTCHIGKISFSMYIVHGPIIRLFEKGIVPLPAYPTDADLRFVLHFVVLTVVSAVIATATYRFIERPGIRLGAWLVVRRAGRPLAAEPAN